MDFERSWSHLNERLRGVETAAGALAPALAELEAQQRRAGFIQDDLSDLERHEFHDPADPARAFRVQYNPKRAKRFEGAGARTPPNVEDVVNNGCFLCRENIRWQQNNAQMGFEITVSGGLYHALMNPFPLFPNHIVLAAEDHVTQEWAMPGRDGIGLARLLRDLLEAAARLPGHVGFYNGVDAGASIPAHLHFQFLKRLNAQPLFPLERRAFAAGEGAGAPDTAVDYPVPVARWRGAPDDVAGAADAWLGGWAEANAHRAAELSSNFIAAGDGAGAVTLYAVPRDRRRARWGEGKGLVGGLEVLGELVLSGADEKALLDAGGIDYAYVADALANVMTPFFEA